MSEIEELRAEVRRLSGPFRCCVHCKDDPEYHAENPRHSHDTDCPTCERADRAALLALREGISAGIAYVQERTDLHLAPGWMARDAALAPFRALLA